MQLSFNFFLNYWKIFIFRRYMAILIQRGIQIYREIPIYRKIPHFLSLHLWNRFLGGLLYLGGWKLVYMIYGWPFKNLILDFLKFELFCSSRARECRKMPKIGEKCPNMAKNGKIWTLDPYKMTKNKNIKKSKITFL